MIFGFFRRRRELKKRLKQQQESNIQQEQQRAQMNKRAADELEVHSLSQPPGPLPEPKSPFSALMLHRHLTHAGTKGKSIDNLILRASGFAALQVFIDQNGLIEGDHYPFPGLLTIPTGDPTPVTRSIPAERFVATPWSGKFISEVNKDVEAAGGIEQYLLQDVATLWRSAKPLLDDLPDANAFGLNARTRGENHRLTMAALFGHPIPVQTSSSYIDPRLVAIVPHFKLNSELRFVATHGNDISSVVEPFAASALKKAGAQMEPSVKCDPRCKHN